MGISCHERRTGGGHAVVGSGCWKRPFAYRVKVFSQLSKRIIMWGRKWKEKKKKPTALRKVL